MEDGPNAHSEIRNEKMMDREEFQTLCICLAVIASVMIIVVGVNYHEGQQIECFKSTKSSECFKR